MKKKILVWNHQFKSCGGNTSHFIQYTMFDEILIFVEIPGWTIFGTAPLMERRQDCNDTDYFQKFRETFRFLFNLQSPRKTISCCYACSLTAIRSRHHVQIMLDRGCWMEVGFIALDLYNPAFIQLNFSLDILV